MIYLYLKTHKKTGLKYLGKTSQHDPFTYTGSGKRWKSHIKKHGYNVETTILLESENINEIKEWGIYYSKLWNIVNNANFANLKLEEGDGGDTSHCEAYKISIKNRDLTGSKNPMYGRSAIKEQNFKWYNNGEENLYISEGTQPENFILGRIIKYKKPHSEETKKKLSLYGTKKCMSPSGEIFNSRKEAAKAYNITPEAIGGLIKRGISGWKWL